MIERLRQLLMGGTNNKMAGRDIIEYGYNPFPIRFFAKDIKEVIRCFEDHIGGVSETVRVVNDMERPDIEDKNELNNLSERYFEYIKSESLMFFEDIKEFLGDYRNKEYLQKYKATALEINQKIMSTRHDFDYFDRVFDAIYSFICESVNYELAFDRNLIWIFLHYMYWNCDIGEKHVTTR